MRMIFQVFADIVRDSKPAQPNPDAECYKSTMFEQWLDSSNVLAQSVRLGKKAPPASDYSKGRWIRTLNGQETCYLYIHTTTYQMQGTRPSDFVSDGDDAPKAVRAVLASGVRLPAHCSHPDGAARASRIRSHPSRRRTSTRCRQLSTPSGSKVGQAEAAAAAPPPPPPRRPHAVRGTHPSAGARTPALSTPPNPQRTHPPLL